LDKSIENHPERGRLWAVFTKSDILTMETIPNCTNLHAKKERKNLQNLLQDRFFCDILEQNRAKIRAYLYISLVDLPLHKHNVEMNIF
jgi:hypothetical protein